MAKTSHQSRGHTAFLAFDKLPDSGYVRADTVALLRDCSISTVWRLTKQGKLPTPVKLSKQITGWRVGELRQHLAREVA